MPSKFEQMRHRENRRMRANFYATNHATHMSNQKIRNHFYNVDHQRHRENSRMRGFFTKSIPGFFNSAAKGVGGLLGGKRGGGGGGGGGDRMEGGESGAGAYGGGAGSGGISDSGSIANPDNEMASSNAEDSDGSQSLPIIPIVIGVAVVGYFMFSKK